ncbi:protein-tyrosine phosphatase-like protein [Baffinella frigidus]|nr:protein-tyrosine phosphatase-like protein [Cryptophyta sp. CCMP2293]
MEAPMVFTRVGCIDRDAPTQAWRGGKNKITHVVNCTDNMPCYHEATREVNYHRFDIAAWWQKVKDEETAIVFTTPVLEFVGEAIAKGESVLVHCLAGAHRAGTTGCLLIMHYADMPVKEAIAAAKKLRPVIDPIGTLPDFLNKV